MTCRFDSISDHSFPFRVNENQNKYTIVNCAREREKEMCIQQTFATNWLCNIYNVWHDNFFLKKKDKINKNVFF